MNVLIALISKNLEIKIEGITCKTTRKIIWNVKVNYIISDYSCFF